MRVLKVINSLNTAGAEKLVAEMIPKFIAQGIDIELLLLNGTQYPLLKELTKNSNCKIHVLGMRSVYNPFLIFKIIPYLRKFDIIHVHLFPAQYWVLFAKLISFSKTKLVFTEHCTTNKRLEIPLYRSVNKHVYSYYAKNICITQEIKNIYLNFTGLPSDKFPVIENGIDLQKITQAKALTLSDIDPSLRSSDRILIQVAAFREQKDQATLLKAMALLPKEVKLLLVGEGVLREHCEVLTKRLKIEGRVFFLGIRNDISQLLKTADVVVLSTHYEGLSLSSIEGMASGKPFIASAVPGLSEIVQGAGILFTEGDEKELAAKISQVLKNETLYNEIALACTQRANAYDINTMVTNYIKLYKSLLN